MFCHQNFCCHFHNWSSLLSPKTLAHICAWRCSEYSIDLSINLFQSLVYKVFVLLLKKKREEERTKEKKWKKFLLFKKKLAAGKESSCC
jgi:hypothetical protein